MHSPKKVEVKPTEETRGKVALFVTCYGNHNEPEVGMDFIKEGTLHAITFQSPEADGAIPSDPITAAAPSERISPNIFVVTITSN